jgi:hypothetical protein
MIAALELRTSIKNKQSVVDNYTKRAASKASRNEAYPRQVSQQQSGADRTLTAVLVSQNIFNRGKIVPTA